MNTPLFERFKKVTSVTLIFAIVFGFMTPAAFADTNGPSNPGTGANITGVGTKMWGTPGNITTDGSPYSNATLNIGETSNYLRGTNYGFNIPSGATINGITVQINRQGSANTLGLGVRDNIVRLVKGGSVVGTNKAITGTTWGTTLNTVTYGGAADLWGTTWTPSDINATNFGAVLSATTNAILPRTATVDSVKITVNYTPDTTAPVLTLPPNISQEAVSSSGNVITFAATATDVSPASPAVNCTPASGSSFLLGTTTVNCSSTDSASNTVNGSFTVSIQDTTKPVIALNGSNPATVQVLSAYVDPGATITDNYYTGLTATVTGSVDTSTVGTYTLYYNVTDGSGNEADLVERVINVVDQDPPSTTDNVPAAWQTGDTTVTLTCTDNVACDKAYYTTDGNDPTPLSSYVDALSSWQFLVTTEGQFVIKYFGIDATNSELAKTATNTLKIDKTFPSASSVMITSSNTNPLYAKTGDTIILSFTTSETINIPTVTIAGKTATVTNTGNDYTATYLLTALENEGTAAIVIDFSDIAGNTSQITTTTDSSSVIIDTLVPTPFNIFRPSDNEIIEEATTNSEGSCETGTTITISGSALQTDPTTITCVGGQFSAPITFTPASLDTNFNLTFTQTDTAGNTETKTINNIQYKTKVVGSGGSGPANTDFVDTNGNPITPSTGTNPTPTATPQPQPQTPPTPTPETPTENPTPENNPTPTPETPANPETNPEETPAPTPAPTPTPTPTPATGGGTTGGTGGNPAPFNPADATLDIGGGVEPDAADDAVEEESFDPADATLDEGGGEPGQESSYTLLWILLGLLALLNTWWFFVAKNKKETQPYRN